MAGLLSGRDAAVRSQAIDMRSKRKRETGFSSHFLLPLSYRRRLGTLLTSPWVITPVHRRSTGLHVLSVWRV